MTTIKIKSFHDEEVIIRKHDKCTVGEIKEVIQRALDKLDKRYPVPAMKVEKGELV